MIQPPAKNDPAESPLSVDAGFRLEMASAIFTVRCQHCPHFYIGTPHVALLQRLMLSHRQHCKGRRRVPGA